MKERKYKEDYQIEVTMTDRGRDKRVAVYRGKWYSLNVTAKEKNLLRIFAVGAFVLFIIFYLLYMKLSTPSSRCMYVLPVAAAGLLPAAYWAMGLFTMLRAPERMTSVQKESGIGRVMRSGMGCMALTGIAAVGDVIFLFTGSALGEEWPGLMLLCCCALAGAGCFLRVKAAYDQIKAYDSQDGGKAQ